MTKPTQLLMTLLLLASTAWLPARADTVLYDNTGFVVGQQSFTKSFNIDGPGTLTVSLGNVNWPVELASLNLLLGTASGMLGPEMGAGTASFDIKDGGFVFAQWFGTAQGSQGVGVFSLQVSFAPAAAAPVPLPTSCALLLSGFALLYVARRKSGPRRMTIASA